VPKHVKVRRGLCHRKPLCRASQEGGFRSFWTLIAVPSFRTTTQIQTWDNF